MSYDCRGCDGTCCTGLPGYPCTCEATDGDMSPEFSKVLTVLREWGAEEVVADGSRFFQCPTHNARRPSLSVRQGEKGVLITCHAGCPTEEILQQLGLKRMDLVGETEGEDG